jgi:hypothetical protein
MLINARVIVPTVIMPASTLPPRVALPPILPSSGGVALSVNVYNQILPKGFAYCHIAFKAFIEISQTFSPSSNIQNLT